jgi:putative spermidine/putrescine transport system substrate-binding protein
MSKITRRNLMQSGLAAGAFFVATSCSPKAETTSTASPTAPAGTPNNPNPGPTVLTNSFKDVTLRFIGTGVSQVNEIKEKAEKDLGFKIQLRALSTEENNQIAITQPKQYDIFDGEYFSLPLVVPSGNIQPIDVKKIKNFGKITPIFTTGELAAGAKVPKEQPPGR